MSAYASRDIPSSIDEGRHAPSVQTNRIDPNSSIEDYSRVMLQYTQNRMASFFDVDEDKGSAPSSGRSSQSSGQSGRSSVGAMARGAGPTSMARNPSAEEVQKSDKRGSKPSF